MAETLPKQQNVADPRVKQYVDYAQKAVDEQAILDKFNAATLAQYGARREQDRQAENNFYNQMYNTQKTAMDTIRQSNAAAVSSGASRGVQAANELSALLGLEQESVASATELAQASRQTAQEETAAVLENVLNAYQQAQQERSQLVQQAIEADSLGAQENTAQETALMDLQTAAKEGATQFATLAAGQGRNFTQYSPEGSQYLDMNLTAMQDAANDDFASAFARGTQGSVNTGAQTKYTQLETDINSICTLYGLNPNDPELTSALAIVKAAAYASEGSWFFGLGGKTKGELSKRYNDALANLKTKIKTLYNQKAQ